MQDYLRENLFAEGICRKFFFICRNFWSLFAGKSVFAVIPANKKFICRKFYLQELLRIKAYLQEILQIPILLQIKTINKIF